MQSSNYLARIFCTLLLLSLARTTTSRHQNMERQHQLPIGTKPPIGHPPGEPQNEDDVIIPDSTSTFYKPVVDTTTNYINSLVLQNRASLQISETGTLWLFMDPAGDPPYPPPPTKIHIQANAKIHLYGQVMAGLAPKIVIDASGTLNNWGEITNSPRSNSNHKWSRSGR